jgi:hypothetical protein
LRQKYPKNLIDSAIEKAKIIPIGELRKPTSKNTDENSSKIPLVVTHNPQNHKIFNTVKQCFPILQQSETLYQLVKITDIIHSRRQPPNLKKLLTEAKFTSNDEKPTVSKCNDPRYGTCQHLQTGETITLNTNMTCKSRNFIYCTTCGKCGENYIGQTGTKLAE